MANFGSIVNWVLQLEDRGLRGNTVNLKDGAGWTRFGITSENCPSVPMDFFVGPDRLENDAAIEIAKQAYYDHYWTPLHLGQLQTDELAATLISFDVNDGDPRAVKLLQGALGLSQDGVMGALTLGAMLAHDGPQLAAELREAQEDFYRHLVIINPADARFLNGWVTRARVVYPDLP